MSRYENTKLFISEKLKGGLRPALCYHNIHHTFDVLEAAEMIGKSEGITDQEMELLKVAVLFHDSGFMINSENHEKISCDYVKENLPRFGYNEKEIEIISGMIMATKYPHAPKNKLEEIICDADLDYLGRDDFFTIGHTLFMELSNHNILSTEQEWNKLQEKFLSSHIYFTRTAKELRNKKKEMHLQQIRELVKSD